MINPTAESLLFLEELEVDDYYRYSTFARCDWIFAKKREKKKGNMYVEDDCYEAASLVLSY